MNQFYTRSFLFLHGKGGVGTEVYAIPQTLPLFDWWEVPMVFDFRSPVEGRKSRTNVEMNPKFIVSYFETCFKDPFKKKQFTRKLR